MKDQDKTKEQLLEELVELRHSEAQWRSVAENASLFVAVVDQSGKMEFLNRYRPGFTAETVLGKDFCDFIQPEYHAVARECLEQVFQSGEATSYESVGAGAEGTLAEYVTDVGPVIVDGEIIAATLISRDITDRKRAEEALRVNEERMRQAVRAANLGVFEHDHRTDVIQWSAEMRQIYGIEPEEPVSLSTILDFFHPDDREGMAVAIQRTHDPTGDGIYSADSRIIRRDGTVRWLIRRSKTFFDGEAGMRRPIRTVGVVMDITDRKRAEEALQKAHDELEQRVEERTAELTKANEELVIFRKFAEASGQGFGMGDLDSRIAYVNPALCRLMGEENPEDVLGGSFLTYYPAEWKQRRENEVIPTLDREGHWAGEQAILSRQDKLIPTLHDVFLLRDEQGAPVCQAVVVTDITERKRAEDALRASEERYELAVRGAGVGIWDWDIRSDKLYFSPRWKMLFGYGENDIGDSIEDWAGLLHPDEKDWMLKFLEDFLAGTSATVGVEYRLRHKDGSYRWIVAHGLVLRDEQGKAYRFVGSHGDITDRKRAEEALAREHQTRKHLLQSSDHERQVIAYEIHDGLAQQLAAAIMQFDAFEHFKETKPKQAADAYHAAMTMLRHGYFEARRLIAGVRPPILDEEGIVAAVGHLINEEQREKGPKIEYLSKVEFERLNPLLENAMYRIVQEALTNACRYSKSKKVQVELVQSGAGIRIEVRDHGIGFNPANIEENQFGLAGIRERARLLGGTATVESEPGKGTRIAVELPVIVAN